MHPSYFFARSTRWRELLFFFHRSRGGNKLSSMTFLKIDSQSCDSVKWLMYALIRVVRFVKYKRDVERVSHDDMQINRWKC